LRAHQLRLPRQLEAAHLGHPDVGDEDVDGALGEVPNGFEGVAGGEDDKTRRRERMLQHLQDRIVIVDHEKRAHVDRASG
jgi:hypothetical protein